MPPFNIYVKRLVKILGFKDSVSGRFFLRLQIPKIKLNKKNNSGFPIKN